MKPQLPLFRRKNIQRLIMFVVLGYVALWFGVLIQGKIDQAHKRTARNAEQAKFQKLSKEEQAIAKAQTYFLGTVETTKTSERLFLAYVQRKFDLNPKLGAAGPPMDLYENPKTYPEDIHFLARIAFPDRLVTVLPKSAPEGPALTNIYAANCDHLPLPKNFWPTMEDNYKKGGYYLTHDALALAFMKDNKCSIPSDESDLASRVTSGMVDLLEDEATSPDLRYETVAFLQMSGNRNLVKPDWVNQIVSEQKADGSWSEQSKEGESSDHATLLALWALLEYSRPNTPSVPLIQQPTGQ